MTTFILFYIIVGIIVGSSGVALSLKEKYAKSNVFLANLIAFVVITVTWPVWAGAYLSRFI
jgi:hypothetical protein